MKPNRLERGFTFIETLVVLIVMMAVAAFTLPELFAIMNRSKLEGTARQTATLMRAARLEAIKQSCYGVVMLEPANNRVIAFADLDRDGEYEPANVPPERLIGHVDLPARVHFGPVEGFNNPETPVPLPDGQAMYEQGGSVLSIGALRFADEKGNELEVNVAPKNTGKVEVRKHQGGDVWTTNGEGGKAWKFNK